MSIGRLLSLAQRALAACAVLLCIASSSQEVAAVNGGRFCLESGGLTLAFETAGDRLLLTELRDAGGQQWLSAFDAKASIWRLAFQGPNGAAVEAGSADAELVSAKQHAGKLTLVWAAPLGEAAAAVNVTVRPDGKRPLSYWSLKCDLPNGWRVVRSDFPVIPNVALAKGLKLAAPAGWGLEYDVKPGTGYEGTYPSCVAAMQFVAFYGGGTGLYIGAHDPRGSHKHFSVRTREDGVGFHCVNWPALSEKPGGSYALPYECAIGVFDGDYYDAAQIYREFSYKTVWGKGGPVSKRPIPQWLKDTDVWLMPAAEPIANVDACRKAVEKLGGASTSLHWYNWHQIPFDTLYPEYFPAKPSFAEGVKALQDAGLHVMPYINGRLCDPKSHTWNEEQGSKSAARQENGEPYTEVYGSKVPLNVMCPHTQQWQEKIEGIVNRLVGECGVDGVYIDQISAAAPVRCFDASHGHPLGGGSFWVDSYRQMLADIRRTLPEGKMLTTEEDAECWIDQLDALLLVNTPTTPDARPIPLFPAVYSGRTITFGFQYLPADDIEKSLPFRAKMARAFLWGAQLGWVGAERLLDPKAEQETAFLADLAGCRRFAHKHLSEGRFLGMIDVLGRNPRMKCEATRSFGGTYGISFPSVMASAWLAEDGSLGVALVNVSGEKRQVEIALPLAAAGIAPAGLRIDTCESTGIRTSWQSDSALQTVSLGPRSALILSATPADRAKPACLR